MAFFTMDNYDISDALGLYAKLAELHDENPFKVKAYAAAAFNIKKIKEPLSGFSDEALDSVQGVGKSVIDAIKTIVKTHTFPDLQKAIEKTPEGVLAMLRIKGLGPKKVKAIWQNMGIDTVEQLFDSCRENRLVEQSGFGLKTQSEIIKAIEFSWNASGKYHYARVLKPATEMIAQLRKQFPSHQFEFTGDFRRCADILDEVEILTTAAENELQIYLSGLGFDMDQAAFKDTDAFKYKLIFTEDAVFEKTLFETSATAAHLQQIEYNPAKTFVSEQEVYSHASLPFIEPEMREGHAEVKMAREGRLQKLLEFTDLKGILHNHSTYSDGLHTLREMAEHCKALGYEYLGICDHSRSAGYAGGLQVEKVLQQWKEIDVLNAELAPFRIIKGIESDILGDGNLDYEPEILAGFELVVASVHSNLKMDLARATERITKAIENPYTHILGHPTGRLLLVREGYPIDHKFIIDACAANGVCIEVNANPFRLDLDWRWIGYAMEKGVMLSINPDAHDKTAYNDMRYGTISARKGGLSAAFTLNAMPLAGLTQWLNQKRNGSLKPGNN
jgi:DNA polymerase (family 10)